MIPARPAPTMATFMVSGIGTVRGSVGCESRNPPCSSSNGTNSSSTSEPSAMGNSRRKSSGSSAAGASVGRGTPSASATASTSASAVPESVTPARSGGSGTWEIFGPNRSIDRQITGELRQHRDKNTGVGLAQLVTQFIGVHRGGIRHNLCVGSRHDNRVSEHL